MDDGHFSYSELSTGNIIRLDSLAKIPYIYNKIDDNTNGP